MKIAYILYPEVIVSNKSNGIRSQAECWASLLEERGHTVVRVNDWGNYNWSEFDVIHIFQEYQTSLIQRLSEINDRICLSPILDPHPNQTIAKDYSRLWLARNTKGRLYWLCNKQYTQISHVKKIFVRSEFEGEFFKSIYAKHSPSKVALIPLSHSVNLTPVKIDTNRENICFHISSIYQPRKNVIRLIEAAKKYKFELYLAGNHGNEEQFVPLKEVIGNANNIHVMGFISEEEKIAMYKKAKVFALPSLFEGVGIVALDAALYGCEIVITNIRGPKEYYRGLCQEVDPYDIDSIGTAIVKAMSGEVTYQPQLSAMIADNYSPKIIAQKIEETYLSIK